MRPDPATSSRTSAPSSAESRRLAVVAALRAVRDEEAAARPSMIAALQAEVRRLAERIERVEDTVELIQRDGEAPLTWPTAVSTDNTLEVPPLEVSRRSSPAFDVLLGPSPADEDRDSA